METDLSGSSICNLDQGELLKSAKAKMGEVREENDRLKKLLAQVVVNYNSLENHISSMTRDTREKKSSINHKNDNGEDPELVSLTLGNSTSNKEYYGDTKKHFANSKRIKVDTGRLEISQDNSDLIQKSTLSNEEAKEEENIETRSTSRGDLKSKEKTNPKELDEESLQQPQVKKTRVCIRSRCDTTTMNDGCQWRKYGQKIAKGNPCPRAYYRCTVSPTCPVRKQVQRCVYDMTILITTYEGTHNHPLPMSATAMASATSAAAAMLKTGSLTSQQHLVGPTTNHLHNSNNSFVNPFITNPRLSIPNPSMISTSSHSHPTITLDLTAPNTSPFNNWFSSSSSSSSRNNTPGFLSFCSSPASYSTSLNFNYGTLFPNNNTMNSNRNIYQNNPSNPQTSMNETIAAMATKVIASNPNFQSVLAAAVSYYVGNNNNNNNNSNKAINNTNDQINTLSPSRINAQLSEGSSSLMLFPTSLPLPVSKNSASAAVNSSDHINLS